MSLTQLSANLVFQHAEAGLMAVVSCNRGYASLLQVNLQSERWLRHQCHAFVTCL